MWILTNTIKVVNLVNKYCWTNTTKKKTIVQLMTMHFWDDLRDKKVRCVYTLSYLIVCFVVTSSLSYKTTYTYTILKIYSISHRPKGLHCYYYYYGNYCTIWATTLLRHTLFVTAYYSILHAFLRRSAFLYQCKRQLILVLNIIHSHSFRISSIHFYRNTQIFSLDEHDYFA